MFTPARIFLALGLAFQAIPLMAGADKLPWWAGMFFGVTAIFCQVVTGVTGPVQNNSSMNAVAKEAVKQAKDADA